MGRGCRGSTSRSSAARRAASVLSCLVLLAERLSGAAAMHALPTCSGCRDWPVHAGYSLLPALGDISPQCSASLQEYLLCKAVSDLFSTCSNDQLFNSSEPLRELLNCTGGDEKLADCKKQCILDAEILSNQSLKKPCGASVQAMHGFGAQLDIFTMGQVDEHGVPKAILMPLPNMKNMAGPTLIKFGQPAHCAEIPSAQYCVIMGSVASSPSQAFSFGLGNCLPAACTEDELRSILKTTAGPGLQAEIQCDLVRPMGPAEGLSKDLEEALGWGGIPVYYPNKVKLTVGAALTGTLIIVLAALMAIGTYMEWTRERAVSIGRELNTASGVTGIGLEAAQPLVIEVREPAPAGAFENFANHWSLLRNTRSLARLRKGEKNPYACIDFLKTFSMAQVILGHSFFYILSSAGFANMEQFTPPYGLLGSFWFQIIPGCFYGVDSFFVISGFLCAVGLDAKLFKNPANRKPVQFSLKYLQFLLFRWLRLVPTEMFCIAFSTTLLPYMGTGILWNMNQPAGGHCYEANGSSGCGEYWWTNLLFIQDLNKYTAKCYGHTWYLANDFQMYATAPFFGLVYSIDRRAGWCFLSMAMLVGLVIPVVMTVQNDWVPEIIAGSSKGFADHFYFKPWCRCPAFFLGIGLGWAWPTYLEQYKGRHQTCARRLRSYGWALLGLALCFTATFGRMSFFQCSLEQMSDPAKSPVPKFWQYMWAAFGILAWCCGLGITMILCFQGRFLPLLENILNLPMWQPIAKLSYSTYLIHTSVLIMDFCQQDSPIEYMPSTMFFNFVAFTATSLFAAFWIYMFVEKPAANLQMKLLGGGGE